MTTLFKDQISYETYGETIAAGKPLYKSTGVGNDSGRTAGRLYLLDVATADRNVLYGIAKDAGIAADANKRVVISGKAEGFSALTPGVPVYAGATAGSVTQIKPNSNIQVIGIAQDADTIFVNGALGGSFLASEGGSGVGGVDILFAQDFESAALGDFTQTGLSLSSSSPLRGAVSALMTHDSVANRSFKQVVAVDEKFRGQAMLLELNVKSTASAGNVTLNVYDETNAANIVASEQLTLSSATGGIKVFSAFTIPATCLSLSYTITALPEAGSPVTRIDDILCQLNNASLLETSVTVPNITAWQSYTPTGSWTSNSPVYTGRWRQVGEDIELQLKVVAGGAPNAANLTINLPNGFTIDSSKIPLGTALGTGYVEDAGVIGYAGFSNYISTTAIGVSITDSAATYTRTAPVSHVVPFTFAAGDFVNIEAKVPVLGLSATSDVAIPLTQSGIVQEADGYAVLSGNAGQAITADVTNISFASILSSTGSVGNWGGSSLTILEDGVFSISVQATFTAGLTRAISLFKNGTYVRNIGEYASSTIHSGVFTGAFKKDDIISFRVTSNGGTLSNSTNHSLEITKQGSLKQVTVNTNSKITIPTSELRFEGASAKGTGAEAATVKYLTIAKVRGDAFTISSSNGTLVTMTKAGKLNIAATLLTTAAAAFSITKNQTAPATYAPTVSEIMAGATTVTPTFHSAAAWEGNVAIGDVFRVSTGGTPNSGTNCNLNFSFQEQDIQVSVSNTLPQFSESDSSVRVDTANGYGSTNTTTRRFANVVQNIGTDIEYVDSPTLGGQFIAKSDGIYSISFSEQSTANSARTSAIITLNGTSIALDADTYATATIVAKTSSCSWQGHLSMGDIITATVYTASQNNGSLSYFTMSKVGKPNVTGVDVTPFVITQFDKGSIGEIKAFAGNVDAMHYLECDGRAVSRGSYSDLFAAIGITHGQGDGSLTFNIPDYRGRFLRGTSGAATLDPDKLTRTAMNTGGNTGNAVGSVQADAFASHNHSFSKNTNLAQGNGGAFTTGTLGDSLTRTLNDATGGNETRPENAYVNYGIRFKAANEAILTETDTFSTDTAALVYAPSSTYTLATLANAPVGTYITYTYAASTNSTTQTTGTNRPTQTDTDMNANGFLIYSRAYTAASTAAQPTRVGIQIGKGLKGSEINAYFSASKTSPMTFQITNVGGTAQYGTYTYYDEKSGVLILDAGVVVSGNSSTGNGVGIDITNNASRTSGYLVINASKNPALVGVGINRVAARGVSSSGQSIANSTQTTVTWNSSKTYDTNEALNNATGVFTAPETGYYQVNSSILYTAIGFNAPEVADLYIVKNGTIVGFSRVAAQAAVSVGPSVWVSDVVFLAKGDLLRIDTLQNSGAAGTLSATSSANYFSIAKVSV